MQHTHSNAIQMLYAVFIVLLYMHTDAHEQKKNAWDARVLCYLHKAIVCEAHLWYCYWGFEHLDSPGGQPSHAQLQAASWGDGGGGGGSFSTGALRERLFDAFWFRDSRVFTNKLWRFHHIPPIIGIEHRCDPREMIPTDHFFLGYFEP